MVKITANTVDIADMIKALDVDYGVSVGYVKRLVAFAADMNLLGGTSGEMNASGDLLITHQGQVVGIYSSNKNALILNGCLVEAAVGEATIRFALRFMRALDYSVYGVMKSLLRQNGDSVTIAVSEKTAREIGLTGLD